MVSIQSIISSIEKFGSLCKINLPSSDVIEFKGIIYPSYSALTYKYDFLHTDPYSTSLYNLIAADQSAINYLEPNIILSTKFSTFQTLKCEKFNLKDNTIYVSVLLLPINQPEESSG